MAKLFENTLRWLSEPSLKSGSLGGYVQDPQKLVCPNLRKKPDEYFSQFDSYQNPTPPGNVYRGLIGARTRYSTGQGTVEEYAKAAKDAGLDFVVFLEEFGKKGGLTEAKYRQLEADCKRLSNDKLFLLPGFSFRNNIGNHQFAYGYDILWPTSTQFVGANGDELRHQCFDKDGNLDLQRRGRQELALDHHRLHQPQHRLLQLRQQPVRHHAGARPAPLRHPRAS